MNKKEELLLWIVTIVHRNGYEAPAQFVEAKKRTEAINSAKKIDLIARFPEKWSFHLTPLYEIKQGKRNYDSKSKNFDD